MKKERIAFLFLSVLILSVFVSTTVSAQGVFTKIGDSLKGFMGIWEEGPDANATLIKWFFLGLIILLIYASLTSANFPESKRGDAGKFSFLRWLIAIIVGLLATVFITTPELVAAIQGYKALGITFILFVPLMILAFFTFAVASKVNPFGIVVQRIAWIIYSVYLFIKTGVELIIQFLGLGLTNIQNETLRNLLNLFSTDLEGGGADTTIILILFIVSIAVFFIFVVGNEKIVRWFQESRQGADLTRYRDDAERQQRARKVDSQLTKE